MLDCVRKELEDVKDYSLIDYVGQAVTNPSIRELYTAFYPETNDTSTLRGQKEEKEQQQKERYAAVFRFYEKTSEC